MTTKTVHLPRVPHHIPDTLVVHEIYASIQGESSFAGVPCAFVRLTGCNLRCTYCDTEHAFYDGRRMARTDILREALAFGTPLVELTGGEPLLQPGAVPLMAELADAGRTVLLETSGERDISLVDPRVHRIVDFKTPSSGEHASIRWENVPLLSKNDEVKFVMGSREDYEFARNTIALHELATRVGHVLLSTIFGQLEPKTVVEWMLQDKVPGRFQLQMHKVIWPADATGV